MTNQNTLAVLEAAMKKDPLALKEALETALAERIETAIAEVQASMFSEGKDEDCDCDDDESDEDDDSDEDGDEDDEDLDEASEAAVAAILEAAEEEGLELSEDEVIALASEVLEAAYVDRHRRGGIQVDVKDGQVDKSKLDPNKKYRIRYRGPRQKPGGEAHKATATHAVAYTK